MQAELPFKSKPKNMEKRKRPTLEQKRAVVLEPGQKTAVTLVQQLNALRNAKELKRRAQQDRRRKVVPCTIVAHSRMRNLVMSVCQKEFMSIVSRGVQQEHAKRLGEEEAWRQRYNKEEKKKRYVAAGLAEKQKSKRQRTE